MDTPEEWHKNVKEYLTDKKEHLIIAVMPTTVVSYGWENDLDLDFCRNHNIVTYDSVRDGGTVVISEGSLAIGFIYNNRIYKRFVLSDMLKDFCNYLKSIGLDSLYNRNDVLIDGYKVTSGFGYNIAPDYEWTFEGVQMSIDVDLDLINNICKKEMKKIPKGLSEYGFSIDDVKSWVTTWFKDNNIS